MPLLHSPCARLCNRPTAIILVIAVAVCFGSLRPAGGALTPDSPQVQRLIEKGMAYLDNVQDRRLGGICLIGLCQFKHTGDPQQRQVVEAVEACKRVCVSEPEAISVDIYSTGIAIFFLCEVDAEKYSTEIEKLVQSLILRQKTGGGFGYPVNHNHGTTGDTSMTQYAVLGLWSAKQRGISVPQEVVEKVCNWLIRTQDPSGAWGYQGKDPESYVRVKQSPVRHSLAAAGLGSTYISAHMLGLAAEAEDRRIEGLPDAFRRVAEKPAAGVGPKLDEVEPRRVRQAQIDGNRWFVQNLKFESERWVYYYMYALERCMSFRELVEGREPGTTWYDRGVRFLQEQQQENGSWNDSSPPVDTAFAILFLMRGTKKAIETTVSREYDGKLVAGRGLPKNTSTIRLQDGVLVGKSMAGSVEEMLKILEDPQHQSYQDALRFPPVLDWKSADESQRKQHIDRLQKIVTQSLPEAQVRAIEMLAASGELDVAPVLIAALRDDDLRVTLAARDGLRRLSRRFGGFGLSDRPERFEIDAAADKWKDWYVSVVPDAK